MDLRTNDLYLIIFLNVLLILKKSYFYRVSYFDLNLIKGSVLSEFDIDLDLTAVFNLKKSSTCSLYLSQIEHVIEYKYYWSSETFSIWWV